MDQDIRFQLAISGTNSANGTAYLAVPYRCTLRDVRATLQGALASLASVSAVTLTIANGSTSLGAIAFTPDASGDIAAGTVGTYTPDASSGSTVLAADAAIKVTAVTAASSVASSYVLDVELDPYARSL